MILMTDLHLKRNGVRIKWWDDTHKVFLDELVETLHNEVIVICGDIFDKEVNPAEVFDDARLYFEKLVENGNTIHIVRGNHDFSTLEGCSLVIFERIKNVHVYREVSFVDIEGYKCLMIPHYSQTMKHSLEIKDFKEYIIQQCIEKDVREVDYIFSHNTLPELAINEEGLSLRVELFAKYEFSGHIHLRDEGEQWLNLGTPYQCRSDEEDKLSYIYSLKNEILSKIELKKQTLIYRTIDFNIFQNGDIDFEMFDDKVIYTLNLICDNNSMVQGKVLESELREKVNYIRKLQLINKDDECSMDLYESETKNKSDKDIFTLLARRHKSNEDIQRMGLEIIDEIGG